MGDKRFLPPQSATRHFFQIRLRGYLDPSWTELFGGWIIWQEEEEVAVLYGSVQNQAALVGLLFSLQHLGLSLLSLIGVGAEQEF